jgi:hypothetical protein
LTQKKHWTDSQRTMMQRANRYYGLRGVIFLIALALLSAGGYEAHGRMRANALRDRLLEASTADVPGIVREMDPYRRWLDPLLREANAQAAVNEDRHKRLHASLALLPSDAGQVDYLLRRLLDAEPDEMLVIRAALVDHQRDLAGRLWAFVEDPASAHGQRLRAAGALAEFDPNSARWPKVAGDVAATLVTQDPFVVARWTEIMRPAGKHLLGPLTDFLLDEKRSYAERGLLAKVYAACAVKTPSPGSGLEKCLAESCDPTASSEARLIHCKKQASCATALMVMGRAEQAWPLLKHQSDPTLRSFILERIAAAGVDPKSLVARLEREADVSIQRAIVLSLGDYGIGRLPAAERDQLRPRIGALYRDHPDPGIHGAADWVLRQWQADPDVRRLDKDLATGKIEANRQWYVSKVGLTMVVVGTPGLVTVGEKKSKRTRRVNRRIAIAAKEVTLEQFLRFHPNHVFKTPIATTLDCPAMGLSWFEAAEYCNWLSAQDGIAEDQWCYVPNADGQLANGMSLAPDWWRRTGYRLPTEAEWVYACRAGAETDFYFGKSFDLVKHYVWNAANSTGRSHPVGAKKPNDFGLFDMHGNVWEWSQDACGDNGEPMDDKEAPAIIDNDRRRVLLGAGWGNQTTDLRPAFHIWNAPTHKSPAVGFRPVRVLAEAN